VDQLRTITETWNLTYHHAAGVTASEFYRRLELGEIAGRRCPACKRVLLPPRSFCDRDFVDTGEWITVGPRGVIEAFTIVYQKFEALPDPPYAIGYVTLKGADTALLNYLRGVDLGSVDIGTAARCFAPGTPVRSVFAPVADRRGRITDFWFELESSSG
jgi:uncharacterized protein